MGGRQQDDHQPDEEGHQHHRLQEESDQAEYAHLLLSLPSSVPIV